MASAFPGHELRPERVHRQLTAVETLRRGRPLAFGTVPSRVRRLCRGWAAAGTLGPSSGSTIMVHRRGLRRTRSATCGRGHEEDGVRGGRRETRSTCEASRHMQHRPESSSELAARGGEVCSSRQRPPATTIDQLRLRRRPRRPAAPTASAARPAPPGTAEAVGVVMPVFNCDSYAQRLTVVEVPLLTYSIQP